MRGGRDGGTNWWEDVVDPGLLLRNKVRETRGWEQGPEKQPGSSLGVGGAALAGEGRDGRNFWGGGVVEHSSQEVGWEKPYLGALWGEV